MSLLLAIKVFLLYSPQHLLLAPNIKYPAINAFSTSLGSEHVVVRTSCLNILSDIFREANITVSVPYIHALAPQVIV